MTALDRWAAALIAERKAAGDLAQAREVAAEQLAELADTIRAK